MKTETLVLLWPFFMIGLAVGVVFVVHAVLDRPERGTPAE
jgi:hypothetical protein